MHPKMVKKNGQVGDADTKWYGESIECQNVQESLKAPHANAPHKGKDKWTGWWWYQTASFEINKLTCGKIELSLRPY